MTTAIQLRNHLSWLWPSSLCWALSRWLASCDSESWSVKSKKSCISCLPSTLADGLQWAKASSSRIRLIPNQSRQKSSWARSARTILLSVYFLVITDQQALSCSLFAGAMNTRQQGRGNQGIGWKRVRYRSRWSLPETAHLEPRYSRLSYTFYDLILKDRRHSSG